MPKEHHQVDLGRRTLLLGAGAFGLAACSGTVDVSRDDSSNVSAVPTTEEPDSPTDQQSSGSSESSEPSEPDSAEVVPDPVESSASTAAEPEPTEAVERPAATAEPVDRAIGLAPSDFAALAVCTALPASTSGPFPTVDQLDRRDVTEGYPGLPLHLGVRVVDDACSPIGGAQVEIWHTDATGDYSSYDDNGDGKDEGAGTTFMRGFQTTNGDGIADFITIYPGWYRGRAVHIHVRVNLDGTNLLTAQLYFDEQFTEQVYASAPYAEFGLPDTTWSRDRLVEDPLTDGTGITLTNIDTERGPGVLGLVNIGVAR